METQVKYEIQNKEGKNIEKGYVIRKLIPDNMEIHIRGPEGSLVSRYPQKGEAPEIDMDIFLEAIWDCRYGVKSGYTEGEYEIIINPDEK